MQKSPTPQDSQKVGKKCKWTQRMSWFWKSLKFSKPNSRTLKLLPSGCFVTFQTSDCNPWISSHTALHGPLMYPRVYGPPFLYASCLPYPSLRQILSKNSKANQSNDGKNNWRALGHRVDILGPMNCTKAIGDNRSTKDFGCFIHQDPGHSHPLHIPQVDWLDGRPHELNWAVQPDFPWNSQSIEEMHRNAYKSWMSGKALSTTELHAKTCEREKVIEGEGDWRVQKLRRWSLCPLSTRFKPTSCKVDVAHGPLRPHLNPQHHLAMHVQLPKRKNMLVQTTMQHTWDSHWWTWWHTDRACL